MAEKYELAYRDYKAGMKQKEIAAKYDVSINTVKSWQQRKWKQMDASASENEKVCTPNSESMHTKKSEGTHTKSSAAEHEQNADEPLVDVEYEEPPRKDGRVKRRGGNPNPKNQFTKRNRAAMIHGLRSKFLFPEQIEIMEALQEFDVVDQLWLQIELSFAAIIRAQKIMWVEDQADHLSEQSGYSSGEGGSGETFKVVYAHERFESFIKAQTRAFAEHRSLVKQFLDLTTEDDERRLKLEQMQLNIEKTKAEINKLQEPEEDKTIQINLVKRGGADDSRG